MAEVHIGLDGFGKLRVAAFWGPLVILVRGRERILLTLTQVKLGWSKTVLLQP